MDVPESACIHFQRRRSTDHGGTANTGGGMKRGIYVLCSDAPGDDYCFRRTRLRKGAREFRIDNALLIVLPPWSPCPRGQSSSGVLSSLLNSPRCRMVIGVC